LKFAFGLWKRHADREFSMVKKTPHQNIESKKHITRTLSQKNTYQNLESKKHITRTLSLVQTPDLIKLPHSKEGDRGVKGGRKTDKGDS
jgi:hypothetical protein